jgi:RNA-binding protein
MIAQARRAGPEMRQLETFTTMPSSGKPLNKLPGKQRRALRARAHHLKPVVSVGAAGLSDGLLAELGIALHEHGLVKIRIAADHREQRKKLIDDLCRKADAELIQRIGHTAVIYKKRSEE